MRDKLEVALENIVALVAPFFKGYSEFFLKYLDVSKYPLSVENIEELVQYGDQYSINGGSMKEETFILILPKMRLLIPN